MAHINVPGIYVGPTQSMTGLEACRLHRVAYTWQDPFGEIPITPDQTNQAKRVLRSLPNWSSTLSAVVQDVAQSSSAIGHLDFLSASDDVKGLLDWQRQQTHHVMARLKIPQHMIDEICRELTALDEHPYTDSMQHAITRLAVLAHAGNCKAMDYLKLAASRNYLSLRVLMAYAAEHSLERVRAPLMSAVQSVTPESVARLFPAIYEARLIGEGLKKLGNTKF